MYVVCRKLLTTDWLGLWFFKEWFAGAFEMVVSFSFSSLCVNNLEAVRLRSIYLRSEVVEFPHG